MPLKNYVIHSENDIYAQCDTAHGAASTLAFLHKQGMLEYQISQKEHIQITGLAIDMVSRREESAKEQQFLLLSYSPTVGKDRLKLEHTGFFAGINNFIVTQKMVAGSYVIKPRVWLDGGLYIDDGYSVEMPQNFAVSSMDIFFVHKVEIDKG